MASLVIGGAGFIGSHAADALYSRDGAVRILDDFSSGSMDNLATLKKSGWTDDSNSLFVGDMGNAELTRRAVKGVDTVYHLAAIPRVNMDVSEYPDAMRINVDSLFTVLECMREAGCRQIVFSSTSTVYGEAPVPTPEAYGPMKPISFYGATKLAGEALISSYCGVFGMSAVIIRFANVVGARSNHGIVWDFVDKLAKNPRRLEVLGDGRQLKSYLHVSDCVAGMVGLAEKFTEGINIFNLGTDDQVSADGIAKIVLEEMGLLQAEIVHAGGAQGGRGWPGDVKNMLLDARKARSAGWSPKYSSEESLRMAAREILRARGDRWLATK